MVGGGRGRGLEAPVFPPPPLGGGVADPRPDGFPGLLDRHRAAMQVIQYEATTEDERWMLLEAVVWPSDVILEMQREAA